jgi:hypothetical protein
MSDITIGKERGAHDIRQARISWRYDERGDQARAAAPSASAPSVRP